jgi:hypothetical protein
MFAAAATSNNLGKLEESCLSPYFSLVPYSNSIACFENFKLSTPTIVWKADIFQGRFTRLVRLDAKSPVDG